VVFDSVPFLPLAEVAIQLRVPIILSVRKMRDMTSYFAQIEPFNTHLSLILFPHEPNEIEVPDWLAPKCCFVGRVVRPARMPCTARSTDHGMLVVISGGGGGYDGIVAFYNAALAAIASCRRHFPQLEAILVTGPLFQHWNDLKLIESVRVLPFEPNMLSLLAVTDLAICQAGYNTIAEILESGTPAIIVPAPRDGDDQFERAERAAAHSSSLVVWRDSDNEPLDDIITRLLKNPQTSIRRSGIATHGARQAADAILDVIGISPTSG